MQANLNAAYPPWSHFQVAQPIEKQEELVPNSIDSMVAHPLTHSYEILYRCVDVKSTDHHLLLQVHGKTRVLNARTKVYLEKRPYAVKDLLKMCNLNTILVDLQNRFYLFEVSSRPF